MRWKKNLNLYGIPDKVIVALIVLAFISSLVEMIGLSMFLPIFEFIDSKGSDNANQQSFVLAYVNTFFSYFDFKPSLQNLLLATFALFSISKIIIYIVTHAKAYYLGAMTKNMRDKMLKKYLSAGSDYYDRVDIGNFVNSNISELGTASSGVIIPINIIVTVFSATGSMVLLFLLSYELTIASLLIIVFSFMYPYRWIKASTNAGKKNSKFNSLTTSFLLGRLRSSRLVRLSGTADAEINGFALLTEKQRSSTLNVRLLKAKVNLIVEPIVIGISLLMLYFSMTILNLELSIVVLFMAIILRIIPIIAKLMSLIQGYNRTKGPVLSISKVLDDLDNNISSNLKKYDLINGIKRIDSIELQNVYYKYAESQSFSLNNISFLIKKPSIIAFIGDSGGGKSTLVDILSGYRCPNMGRFLVNNIELESCDTPLLSSLISYVPQDPQVFDGTIYAHISYGSQKSTIENVEKASRLSGAYKFIKKMPDKFNTLLVDNGSNLSGGQRLKIDIARALMRDSSVLLLDEPTSGLDYFSENEFIKIVHDIRNNADKIIVIMTHKSSVAINADQIIILENGGIADSGTHETLLSKNNWYRGFSNS